MRITYFINNQIPGDGVGNSIVELARLLVGMGCELRILYEKIVDPPDDLRGLFTQVSYEQLQGAGGSSEVKQAIAHWQSSELVFFDYSTYYPLANAIALSSSAPKVFVYHGVTPPHLWPHALGRKDVQLGVDNVKLALHADFAVAASEFTCQELIDLGLRPERVFLMPYAVRAERFYPQPKDEALQALWGLKDHFTLLYTGRMASNKRIDTLVSGLAEARKAGLPIKLMLVGENKSEFYLPEVKKAEALAEALGVKEHVIFTGRVSDDVLPRYFNLADLYVSGSLHEGFGIPLVEAMASGKPVVAARAASVPYVLGEGGALFAPEDASEMGRIVDALLRSVVEPPAAPALPPRLCFVLPRYGLDFAGGAETLARRWAETCHAAGWQVQVVATTTDSMLDWSDDHPAGDEIVNGVAVKRFAIDRKTHGAHFHHHHRVNAGHQSVSAADQRAWMELGIGRPPMFEWLAAHQDDFDFFVFLPYLFNTTVLGIEAVKDKAIVIPCLHDEGPAYTQVVREALESARGIFFNAPGERDFALDTLKVANPNCFTLGMGMDIDRRGDAQAFKAKHGLTGEYLVYCGRLEEAKNVPLLLECFSRYKAQHPGPLKLVLIGNGDVPTHPDVLALGFLPEQDKHDALAGALALVNPSVNESFSIVLMESWIQRRPVIVHTRCAVTHDHVARSGGGLAFEDYAGFESAVSALLSQPGQATRMGAEGRRYVEANYSWPVLLDRFEDCLNLLRTASAYEDLAVKGIARARHFAHHRYAERWRAFLDQARLAAPALR